MARAHPRYRQASATASSRANGNSKPEEQGGPVGFTLGNHQVGGIASVDSQQ